ncbi:MAG: MFS transporter [Deltaproteobacteria bacterium]|nr:MFS transporter [Deltaproteobacteria bacterium]
MAENKFYGWQILIGSFLILVIDGGLRFSFGVLIKPLVSEFSWERGAITLAFTVNMVVFACCQPLAGKLLDRFGPKFVFSVAALLTTIGLMLTSKTTSLWDLYVYYGVITAAGTSGISISVVSSTLSRWFQHLRGFVSGVAISGTALGQFLIIPLIALLLGNFGWRSTWIILGLLLSAVVIPVSLLVMRRPRSEDEGKASGAMNRKTARGNKDYPGDLSSSTYHVLRSRNFLLAGATYFICGFQDFFFVTQLIPFATDQGFAAQEASNLQGLAGLLSVPGLLLFAAISERFGRKIPLFLTFLPRLLCFALLIFSTGKPWIYTSALLFGFTLMASAPLASALIGDLYGFQNLGTLTGTIFWIHHLGGALGAYTGGFIYDQTRSYSVAFALGLILAIVAALTSISIRENK